MTLTFDENLQTEKSLQLDYINEQITANRLNGGWDREITASFIPPDLSDFVGQDTFTTLTITNTSGTSISTACTYNKIQSLVAGYSDTGNMYTVNIVLVNED